MSIAASFTSEHGIKVRSDGCTVIASKVPNFWLARQLVSHAPPSARSGFELGSATTMNGVVTVPARSSDFQRAFVAMRYYLGVRGEALGEPLAAIGLTPAANDALARLGASERAERARALGTELGLVASALERRSLLR
jgi:hypothetical protein